jgi:hypothetical protein
MRNVDIRLGDRESRRAWRSDLHFVKLYRFPLARTTSIAFLRAEQNYPNGLKLLPLKLYILRRTFPEFCFNSEQEVFTIVN